LANQGLADRMKLIREQIGGSQKSVSQKLDLGATTWQNYERGLNYPNGETLLRLRQEGFNPTWILTGEGPMRMADGGGTDWTSPNRKTLELLNDCLDAVREVTAELGMQLTEDQVAILGSALCLAELEERSRGRPPLRHAQVIQLIKRYAA